MESDAIRRRQVQFDEYAQRDADGVEYWSARDLMGPLGYSRWENYETAIKRAISSLGSEGTPVQNHFRDATKMVQIGSGSNRSVRDYHMTRYACYLVAMNGDPRKEEVAFAQSYFALATRKQELIEQRMGELSRLKERNALTNSEKELSRVAFEHGVDGSGFAIVRSRGDYALFGGNDTRAMKRRLGLKDNQPLADRLPAITLTAKSLAAQMTSYNVEQNDLFGTEQVASEHVANNAGVRKTLTDRGIYPEDLPAEEDTKKLDRRVKADERKLRDATGSFKRVE